MSGREESLGCLECSVHLPLSPQLISPVAQFGAQEVGVGQDHHRAGGGRVHGGGVLAQGEDQVVDQELVVQQPKAKEPEEAEKFSSDSFHFDLQQSPWDY